MNFKYDIKKGDQAIVVGTHDAVAIREFTKLRAPKGGFFIKSIDLKYGKVILISGDTEVSTLYAAYRFAEHLGCRFYFHGDVIPDQKIDLTLMDFDEQERLDMYLLPYHNLTKIYMLLDFLISYLICNENEHVDYY